MSSIAWHNREDWQDEQVCAQIRRNVVWGLIGHGVCVFQPNGVDTIHCHLDPHFDTALLFHRA
jgi:hypothetical protein